MNSNPFTLVFGKCPKLIIERPFEEKQIIESFSNQEINQQIYLISSVRGSGKTVLMTEIADFYKKDKNWIVISINPEKDMLESLLSKLYSVSGNLLKNLNINLSFFNIFTIGVNLENKITDIETAIIKVLEHLNKMNKRVLITIDEVTNSQYMKVFASSFQIFVRENLPIFLLMTGLYENIRNLQNEKNLTFLYRAPRMQLSPLNINLIAIQYAKVFNLSKEESLKMAKLTSGYAFAFQILGYLTFKNNSDYKSVHDEYLVFLEEYSYNKIWSELSQIDKKILYNMAINNSSNIKDIMSLLDMDNNHFNPYRKRLIDKGVLKSDTRGTLSFSLPLFKEFIVNNYEL